MGSKAKILPAWTTMRSWRLTPWPSMLGLGCQECDSQECLGRKTSRFGEAVHAVDLLFGFEQHPSLFWMPSGSRMCNYVPARVCNRLHSFGFGSSLETTTSCLHCVRSHPTFGKPPKHTKSHSPSILVGHGHFAFFLVRRSTGRGRRATSIQAFFERSVEKGFWRFNQWVINGLSRTTGFFLACHRACPEHVGHAEHITTPFQHQPPQYKRKHPPGPNTPGL